MAYNLEHGITGHKHIRFANKTQYQTLKVNYQNLDLFKLILPIYLFIANKP